MWVIAKVKYSELNIFKKELKKKFDNNLKFYYPKIQFEKILNNKKRKYDKLLLGEYVFCQHENFKNSKLINQLKFVKGLNFFLSNCDLNQTEIINFIKYCKDYEDDNGFIKSSFFKTILIKKAKFVSGPFANMFFDIIEKQKKKLKIIVGNIVTVVPDKKNYLYQPV